MLVKNFEELSSWKLSRELTKIIYQITSAGKFSRDFGLREQLRRAVVSILLNLSEGFDSGSTKSFLNFAHYSYRSSSEVKAILYIASDLEYISQSEFKEYIIRIEAIQKRIGGLIKYLMMKLNQPLHTRTPEPRHRGTNSGK